MKLLYGTGNLAKLSAMRNRLEQLDIELIGLNDLRVEGKNVPEVKEDGNTPLENARLKAMVYYEAFQIPVFSRHHIFLQGKPGQGLGQVCFQR